MNKATTLIFLCVVIVLGLVLVLFSTRSGRNLELVEPSPLILPNPVPIPALVEERLLEMVESEEDILRTGGLQTVPDQAHVDPKQAEPAPPQPEVNRQQISDTRILEEKAAEIAYIEYAGVIAGRTRAVFFNNLKQERKSVLDGTTINDLLLEEVAEEFVVLSYGEAPPLRKPRVDLELDGVPLQDLSEEEKEVRMTRFMELYGHRHRVAGKKARREKGLGPIPPPPSPLEQEEARQRYMETYGAFYRSIRSGSFEEDSRDYPKPEVGFDEEVRRYFDLYWPDVEVETESNDEDPGANQ